MLDNKKPFLTTEYEMLAFKKNGPYMLNSVVFLDSYAVTLTIRPDPTSPKSVQLGQSRGIIFPINFLFPDSQPAIVYTTTEPNQLPIQEFPINKFLYI